MFYKLCGRPLIFKMDAERAHGAALRSLRMFQKLPLLPQLLRFMTRISDPLLTQKLFDITFENPLGLAAGFDKNFVVVNGLASLGFGHIEGGGVTMLGQAGNPKPRMFRVPEDNALINRMGFNNDGSEAVALRLEEAALPPIPLGLNIGKSKDTPIDEAVKDYVTTLTRLGKFFDYATANVSSPNTPELRKLQEKARLREILLALKETARRLPRRKFQPPLALLVKVAPDLSWLELDKVLEVVVEVGLAGIIATNTTVSRERFQAKTEEQGGASGKPLFEKSLLFVEYIRKALPSLPIIGSGGVFTGWDAYRMLAAGANMVQIYTSLVYEGPFVARKINTELLQILEERKQTVEHFSPHVNRN